jgi:hypothetical protein
VLDQTKLGDADGKPAAAAGGGEAVEQGFDVTSHASTASFDSVGDVEMREVVAVRRVMDEHGAELSAATMHAAVDEERERRSGAEEEPPAPVRPVAVAVAAAATDMADVEMTELPGRGYVAPVLPVAEERGGDMADDDAEVVRHVSHGITAVASTSVAPPRRRGLSVRVQEPPKPAAAAASDGDAPSERSGEMPADPEAEAAVAAAAIIIGGGVRRRRAFSRAEMRQLHEEEAFVAAAVEEDEALEVARAEALFDAMRAEMLPDDSDDDSE